MRTLTMMWIFNCIVIHVLFPRIRVLTQVSKVCKHFLNFYNFREIGMSVVHVDTGNDDKDDNKGHFHDC